MKKKTTASQHNHSFEIENIVNSKPSPSKNFELETHFAKLVEGIPLGFNYYTYPKNPNWFDTHLVGCGYNCETSDYNWDLKNKKQKHGTKPRAFAQYTLSGSGKLIWRNKEYDLEAGTMFVLNMSENFKYWLPPQSSHWSFIFLTFHGQEISNFVDEAISAHETPIFKLTPDDPFVKFIAEVCRKNSRSHYHSVYQTMSVAAQWISLFGQKVFSPQEIADYHPVFEKAKEYCKTHFRKEISIGDIADHCQISLSSLISLFQKQISQTPRNYIEKIRLEHACQLILDKESCIKKVSHDCGFNSPNYFSKVFRRKYNMSPIEFSKNIFTH